MVSWDAGFYCSFVLGIVICIFVCCKINGSFAFAWRSQTWPCIRYSTLDCNITVHYPICFRYWKPWLEHEESEYQKNQDTYYCRYNQLCLSVLFCSNSCIRIFTVYLIRYIRISLAFTDVIEVIVIIITVKAVIIVSVVPIKIIVVIIIIVIVHNISHILFYFIFFHTVLKSFSLLGRFCLYITMRPWKHSRHLFSKNKK